MKKVILGLVALVVLSGAVGGIAAWVSETKYDARREVIDKATTTLLQRTCQPADDKDCDFAKRLGAAVIGSADIYDEKEDMLKYAAVSRHMKSGEYAKTTEIVEFLKRDTDNDANKAVDRAVAGYSSLKHNPKFDVDAYLKEVNALTQKRDSWQSVGTVFGVIALIAATPLVLIGLWALFLAMIRSLRRAWINPSG